MNTLTTTANSLEKHILQNDLLLYVPNQENVAAAPKYLVNAIKHQMLDLGFVLSYNLEKALTKLTKEDLSTFNTFMYDVISESIGANRVHIPLYRNFPNDVPTNTQDLWFQRMTTHLMSDIIAEAEPDKVHILSCGHIVHEDHWDGSNYSGCPICEKRVDLNSPFFKASMTRGKLTEKTKLKIIDVITDLELYTKRSFNNLVARKTVLSPTDLTHLNLILKHYPTLSLKWVETVNIPVKENVATIFSTLIDIFGEKAFNVAIFHLKTATDYLRLITALSDGDISLVQKTRYKSIPRRFRKLILNALNNFKLESLTEDMLRNVTKWKHVGNSLHPFEFNEFKNVITAFNIVRKGTVDSKITKTVIDVLDSENDDIFEIVGNEVRFRNWTSQYNKAVEDKKYDKVIKLLGDRAGEFSRRLDFVLRTVPIEYLDIIVDTFTKNVSKMSTPILLTLIGYLKYRTTLQNTVDRVFFPKGNIQKLKISTDERDVLPIETTLILNAIDTELLYRTAKLEKVDYSYLDVNLKGIISPFSERTYAKALVTIPRGSRIKMEQNENIRSFIHWVEPKGNRTDLDTTFVFYDENWKYIGKCAFNDRQFGDGAALHSGDLTSAPAPHGSTEYVDLNIPKLKKLKVKYVVSEVFSFNGVPFHELPVAFAGYMTRKKFHNGEIFEPKTVQQKIDLTGDAQVSTPFILDLDNFELIWMDINMSKRSGTYQSFESHAKTIDKMCKAVVDYFDSSVRPSVFQVSLLHAVTRSNNIYINDNGIIKLFTNTTGVNDLYEDILCDTNYTIVEKLPDEKGLFYCYTDNGVSIPNDSTVYTLYKYNSNAALNYISASDLIAF